MADFTIRALPNGPLPRARAGKSHRPAGNEITIEEGRTVSLCRCGGSVMEPFCDGTHSQIGFQAAEAAVKKEG